MQQALDVAQHYVRSEIVVAAKAPAVALVTLLARRVDFLAQEEKELEALIREAEYEAQFEEMCW
jgi:hypothetical protein